MDDQSVANPDPRKCTCHPDDRPPVPCPRKYALTECRIAALLAACIPFAAHGWVDAELEDDNCKLANGSGPLTVGHWRALRAAIEPLAQWR